MGPDDWQLLQGRIHGIGTSYNKLYSPGFVFGARSAEIDLESIRDQVNALNELVQRQLEEVDRRYMEL